MRVGIAGLGATGREIAKRLLDGIPGLTLGAVSVRRPELLKPTLPQIGVSVPILPLDQLAEHCEIVVECLPAALFRSVAESAIDRARIFMPLSVGQLLTHDDLIARATKTGARILAPTGALIGLDAVRAAAEGEIYSVTMVTRKPPKGLVGAPYLTERGISLDGIASAVKVFDGTAREAARGFPANLNVAAALSLAGIGPDRTRVAIWADPDITRNMHRIDVDSDSACFSMSIENIPSENPKTGRITALSAIAALRGLVSNLKVGT